MPPFPRSPLLILISWSDDDDVAPEQEEGLMAFKGKKSRLFTAFNEARLAVQHWLNSLLLSWTSKQFLEVEKFSPRSSSSSTTTIRCWLHCSCCSPWWCCSRHTRGGARFLCFYKSFLSLIQHWAHNTHTQPLILLQFFGFNPNAKQFLDWYVEEAVY